MYRLHCGVKGRPQGNTVSTAWHLPWFCITKQRVWEKKMVCFARGNESNNRFWVFSRQIVWKIFFINHLQQGHTHMNTHNSSQNMFPYAPQ